MSTGDRNALGLPGQQAKDTETGATNRVRIAALRGYLRGLPSLDFSDKGHATICTRFQVSADELNATVAGLYSRPGQPSNDLLRIIGKAVTPAPRRTNAKGGADPC